MTLQQQQRRRLRLRLRVPVVGLLVSLGVALVLACNGGHDEEDDNQFRTDVLWCEEALSRLISCCPGFDGRVVECNYYYSFDEGCGTATTRRIEPAFTIEESRCIRDTTCDALVNNKVCERAQRARAPGSSLSVPSPGSTSSSSSTTSSSGISSGGSTSTSGFASSGSNNTTVARGPAVCP